MKRIELKNPPWREADFRCYLTDFDADAGQGFAGEVSFLGLNKLDDAIFGGVDGEIAGHVSAWACNFRSTSLTDENFAVFDFLATEALDAKALASIVMDVFGGTASFYV